MSQPKPNSRFDDLFSAAKKPRGEPTFDSVEPTTASPKPSKSTDPEYKRTTIYLPKRLHRQLKAAAADEDQEMSEIVEKLVENYLLSRHRSPEA